MKKILLISLIFISYNGFSQSKYIKKIKKLYENQKYEKCLNKIEKYKKYEARNPELYYLKGFSNFKLYEKSKGEEKLLKIAAREVKNGLRQDRNQKVIKKYKNENKDLRNTLTNKAVRLYSQEKTKSKSKIFYKYLVELYKDTTEQYLQFYVDDESRPDIEIVRLMRQGKLNQKDNEGLKQGPWKKVYPNGATAYEVTFKNDKPFGTMKRYHENGRLSTIMKFNKQGTYASSEMYDENAKLISKGFYKEKQKDSIWVYFDVEKNIIKKERYVNGKLDGNQYDYFKSGEPLIVRNFTNGAENGKRVTYYENGKPEIEIDVVNNKAEGKYFDYYESGKLKTKGQYKNDLRVGDWFKYDKKGKKKKVKYINGKPENWKELEQKKSEELLKQMQNKGKYIDPAKFKNKPDEYLKQINNK